MIENPWIAAFITLILCILSMRFINLLAAKRVISTAITRKLIHIGTGPVFLLCWLLFPDKSISRFLAAGVPFLIVLQVLIVGLGYLKDYTSIKSMARTGDKAELLKGPLIYGIVFVVITVVFWKSPWAVVALMILCGGDGAADLVGSHLKSHALPWNKHKTILGSLSMMVSGTLLSIILIYVIIPAYAMDLGFIQLLLRIFGISIISTIVESITPSDYDNLTVPATALLLGIILL